MVAYGAGTLSVVATSGSPADTVVLTVEPRGLGGSFSVVGNGGVEPRATTDLWVHGDVAYTGTLTSPEGRATCSSSGTCPARIRC